MTNSFSIPGPLELLVLGVIVGAIILVIGPRKSRAALGVLAAIVVAAVAVWFVAVPIGVQVAQIPGGTVRSSIGPLGVTIEGTGGPAESLVMPTPPSVEVPVPPTPVNLLRFRV